MMDEQQKKELIIKCVCAVIGFCISIVAFDSNMFGGVIFAVIAWVWSSRYLEEHEI